MANEQSNVVLAFKASGAVEFSKTLKEINTTMNTAAKEYKAQVAAMGDNASAVDKLVAQQKKLETQSTAAGERVKKLSAEFENMKNDSNTSASALEKQAGKVADAQRVQSNLESALKKVNSQLSDEGKAALTAKEKLETLKGESSQLQSKQDAVTASFKRQTAELGSNATKAEKNALEQKKLGEQNKLAAAQVDNLEKQLKETETAYGENSQEVTQMRTKLDDAKTSEANLKGELSTVNEEIRKQGGVSTETAAKLEKIGDSGTKVSSVGKKLSVGVTAPLVAVGAAAVKTGGDFENQMNRVGAISGTTSGELEKLKSQAVDLGAKTVFNAKEAAGGMENLGSAGFKANEIMKAMPGVLNLAAVSGGDVGVASENAATALRGFGLDASKSGHVANVFAKAAADTNAEVGDMGDAMKYVAPVAHAMGIGLEESAAAIGIMSDAGVKGSQAGTTLRTSMARLADPTNKMSKVIKQYGLNFFDAQGKMKPLGSIIAMLKDKFSGLTKEQKSQAMSTLFGKESLSGMTALVSAGPAKFNKLTKSFKDSGGAAKGMADKMNKGPKAAIDQMLGSLESAAIKITEALAPVIEKVADFAGAMVDKFTQTSDGVKKFIMVIAGIAAVVGPATLIIGKLMIGISKLPATITAVKDGFTLFNNVTKIGTGIQAAFNAVMALNPFTLVVIAIAAVVAALTLFFTKTKTGQKIWKDFVDWLKNAWSGMASFFSGIWLGITSGASKVWDAVKVAWTSFTNWIKSVWTGITTFLSGVWTGIANVAKPIFETIKSIITVVFMTIQSVIQGVWTVITSLLSVAWNGIVALAKTVWSPLADFFGDIWNGIKDVTSSVWNAIKNVITDVTKAIGNAVKDAWNGIKNVTSSVFKAVGDVAKTVWTAIKNVISPIVKAIGTAVKAAWDGIKNVTSSIFKSVTSVAKSAWSAITKVISPVAKAIGTAVKNAWNGIKTVTSSIFKGVASTVKSIWNGIKTSISGVYNSIKTGVTGAWNAIKSATSRIWNSIKTAITTPINAAKNTISNIVSKIKGFFTGMHLRIPKIDMPPLPHFNLNGSFSLKPPSVPHLSVDWYAKGGIFNQPTIFGGANGQLKGAGEAGPEAALPLNAETLGAIGKGISASMGNSDQPIILNIDGRTFAQIAGPYMSDYMKQQDATQNFSYGRRP